jgi:hypothetical protein
MPNAATLHPPGALAEWLRSGLQSLLFFVHFLPLWSQKRADSTLLTGVRLHGDCA